MLCAMRKPEARSLPRGVQSALAAFALVATLNADKLRSDTNAPPRESVEWKVES